MALNYINPGWTNDNEPYIDADNLNAISDNLEEATELIGNETMGTTATTITGAIKELVGRIGSTVIGTANTTITSAIKAIQDKIGTTTMGTSATTVTGAVAELKTAIGSFKYVNFALTYQQGETILSIVQRAYAHSSMPKGVPFVAVVSSGAIFTMIGYWYPSTPYGYCIVQYFQHAQFVNLNNGSWFVNGMTNISKHMAASYLGTQKDLTTSYALIPLTENLLLRGDFERTGDGGIRTTRSGSNVIQIAASANVDGANASDTLLFAIGRYNGGWVAELPGYVAGGVGSTKSCSIASFVSVSNQGDVIYLRGRNVSGARGTVRNARISVEYV